MVDDDLSGEFDEPVDFCDNCGSDIYEDEDDGSGLCDQCQWWLAQSGSG